MFIRLLDATDSITDLTDLLRAAYARLGRMGFNYTAVDQPEDVTRRRVLSGDCLLAVEADMMAGTVIFHAPGKSDDCAYYNQPLVATVSQFGVLPRLQGRGVGSLLLGEAERRAASAGATELALDTSEGADDLIAYYERRGFRSADYVQWPGKTYRSVIMSKPLSSVRPAIIR